MIEALPLSASAAMPLSGASLQSFIDHLLYHALAESLRQSNSQVVNEIPAEFSLRKDEAKILPVIKELLLAVLTNAHKGNITVRAEKFRDIMILEIEDCNNYNGYALDYSLRSLESLARLAGGHISAKGQQQLVSTVSFSFPSC